MAMRINEALRRLDQGVDHALVLKRENIYYLTGYYPTTQAVLVLGEHPYLLVSEMDKELTQDLEIEVRALKSFKNELDLKGKVAVEKGYVSLGFAEEHLSGCELQDLSLVSEMRKVKDPAELRRIKKALALTEETLHEVILEGRTERDVSASINFEMKKKAETAFDPIVAAGVRSSIPHHTPGKKRIGPKDHVILDLGARYDHYCSDMTRTLPIPEKGRYKEVYEAVSQALDQGIRAIRPGRPIKGCDEAIRRVLAEHDLERFFIHSGGHGIGLDVHESPSVNGSSEEFFEKGMVLSIEPGVYIPGWGGVRLEDMVVVGNKAKVLSKYPR